MEFLEYSIYLHQFTSDDGTNVKYVSPDGKYEIVFNKAGQVVTDPKDVGTYNYASPNSDKSGHFWEDVVPYYIWGNSPQGTTRPEDRMIWGLIEAFVKGLGLKTEVRSKYPVY